MRQNQSSAGADRSQIEEVVTQLHAAAFRDQDFERAASFTAPGFEITLSGWVVLGGGNVRKEDDESFETAAKRFFELQGGFPPTPKTQGAPVDLLRDVWSRRGSPLWDDDGWRVVSIELDDNEAKVTTTSSRVGARRHGGAWLVAWFSG